MNEPIKLQISEYGDIPGAISRLEESTGSDSGSRTIGTVRD